jgi:hypothetical protein
MDVVSFSLTYQRFHFLASVRHADLIRIRGQYIQRLPMPQVSCLRVRACCRWLEERSVDSWAGLVAP